MKTTLAILLLCVFVPAAGHAAETTPRPNVVLIISDDQAWGDFGFMGHPQIQTPHLDQLAARSLTFQRGYSPVPLCRSSLASIATGLYPRQHGVTGNDPALPKGSGMGQRANPEYAPYYETIIAGFAKQPNLVRDLTKGGYLALQTGKWWEGDPVATAGFTHSMTSGKGPAGRHGDAGLDIGRKGLDPVYRFIEQAGDKPWFVWYAPMLPHDPHDPPQALVDHYAPLAKSQHLARYWGNVERFDRTVGELLDFLDREGLSQETLVVYVTDNGWIQNRQAPHYEPRSKQSPYDGGVRTPILLRQLGTIAPRTSQELASSIDILPTVLASCGVVTPADLPGVNLLDGAAVAARRHIFGACFTHTLLDLDDPARNALSRWTVCDHWKLIVPHKNLAAVELFDLAADPEEMQNLAAIHPDTVRTLTPLLDAWWTPTVGEKPTKQP